MGSPCELLTEDVSQQQAEQILSIAAAEAWRIEDKFSRYLPNNIVNRINTSDGKPVILDEETAHLIDFADTLYKLSDHHFDISSGLLGKAWVFDGSDHIPSEDLVNSILPDVGWHLARWERPELVIRAGMQIDFGGIGKEYAVDKAADLITEYQYAKASGSPVLLNFGGDLVVTGNHSAFEGWQVGIEALKSTNSTNSKIIRLKQGALATSGDARRFLLKDGVRYGHILNPQTGWPITDAPRSVTVASDTCTQAGMLATLAILRGGEAESFLEEQDIQFWIQR